VDVDLGIEECLLAAVVEQLVQVVLRDDLHQAPRPDGALGNRVVGRLDRHDRKDEQGVDRMALAGTIGDRHEAGGGAFGDAPALGDVLAERTLLALDQGLDDAGLGDGGGHRWLGERGLRDELGHRGFDEMPLGRKEHEA
jgi:hypothetical protein